MAIGLVAGLLGAVLFGVAAVAQAHAARRMAGIGSLPSFVGRAVRDPWMLGVVAAYLGGFFLHAVAIWLLPLYLAQAAVSLSMPITALTALIALHERLGAFRWVAVGAVAVGLALLALGAGEPGRIDPSAAHATGLWLGIGLLLVAGLNAGLWPGAWLGALSGVGYTGSAIAVRGLDTPVTSVVVVIALSVPALGIVAFWIYSTALDKDGSHDRHRSADRDPDVLARCRRRGGPRRRGAVLARRGRGAGARHRRHRGAQPERLIRTRRKPLPLFSTFTTLTSPICRVDAT